MSIDATRWAWRQSVTPTQKLVLLSLADRADEFHCCYPSNARLQSDTGLDRKTIYDAIIKMEEIGILLVKRTQGLGNRYQLIGVEGRETSPKIHTSPKNGTDQSQKRDGHQSQKRDTESTSEPINNQNTIRATCVRTSRTPGPDENRETGKPEKQKSESRTLKTFLEACHADGLQPVPADDPIFDYADKVGICDEMLLTAWTEFKARFLPTAKRQKDWRAHYRNAVRRNWFGLWFIRDGSEAKWTTAGEQVRRENMQ